MTSRNQGVEKVLKKLQKSVEEGNYYEASQMFHSISQRYTKQGKLDDAVLLLHNGILSLLKANQASSAIDLSSRLIEIYELSAIKPSDQVARTRLVEIFNLFPSIAPKEIRKYEFAKMCRRWAGKAGDSPSGDPQMNHVFGSSFSTDKEYYYAEQFLLFGTLDSSRVLGRMACAWSLEGQAQDPGYFAARVALEFLSINKVQHAKICIETFCKQTITLNPSSAAMLVPYFDAVTGTSTNIQFFKSGLLNFAILMVMACERGEGGAEVFVQLRTHYRDALGVVDGYLFELVDASAGLYFRMGQKKAANPFAEIMSMFTAPQAGGTQNAIGTSSFMNLD